MSVVIFSIEQVLDIAKALSEGRSVNSLAKEYRVSKRLIASIRDLGMDQNKLKEWVDLRTQKATPQAAPFSGGGVTQSTGGKILEELQDISLADRKSFSLACQLFTTESLSGLVSLGRSGSTPPKIKSDVWKYILDQGWGKAPVAEEDFDTGEDKFGALIQVLQNQDSNIIIQPVDEDEVDSDGDTEE